MKKSFNQNSIKEYELDELCRNSRNGGFSTVEAFLLRYGSSIVDASVPGSSVTPLMYAAKGGHNEIIELLLKYGADLDKKDSYGETALFYAVAGKSKHTVSLLLVRGADADIKNKNSQTALDAAKNRLFDDEFMVLTEWKNLDKKTRQEKILPATRFSQNSEIHKKRMELLSRGESKNPFKKPKSG